MKGKEAEKGEEGGILRKYREKITADIYMFSPMQHLPLES